MVAPASQPPLFRVLIATPIQNGQMWCETAQQLLSIALKDGEVPGLRFEWERMSGNGVAVARNILVWLMYRKGCHGILFWDSDIIASGADVLGLVRHGKQMVGGLYRHKTEARKSWVANFIPGRVPNQHGLLEVEDVGAGFLFVGRKVFDDIAAKGLAPEYTNVGPDFPPCTVMRDYFSMGVVNNPDRNNAPEYKTEDFMLAHKARIAGHSCHVDVGVRVDHLGMHTFSGKAQGMPSPWIPEPLAKA